MQDIIENVMAKTAVNGRLVQHSSGKRILMYDCPQWPQKASSFLHFCHPNIVMSTEQCTSSVSGYILVFEEKKANHAFVRVMVALFFMICLCITLSLYYYSDVLLLPLMGNEYYKKWFSLKHWLQLAISMML